MNTRRDFLKWLAGVTASIPFVGKAVAAVANEPAAGLYTADPPGVFDVPIGMNLAGAHTLTTPHGLYVLTGIDLDLVRHCAQRLPVAGGEVLFRPGSNVATLRAKFMSGPRGIAALSAKSPFNARFEVAPGWWMWLSGVKLRPPVKYSYRVPRVKVDVNAELDQIKKMLARMADAMGVQIPADAQIYEAAAYDVIFDVQEIGLTSPVKGLDWTWDSCPPPLSAAFADLRVMEAKELDARTQREILQNGWHDGKLGEPHS